MAWACVKADRMDEAPFAALAWAAKPRLSEFNAQGFANVAWAFAAVHHQDE